MVKRILAGSTLALALLTAACGSGDSDPAPQPEPATSSSNAISEADAIARAQAAATEQGFSLEGLSLEASNIFGEWQVSFEPTNSESLEGGFLVVLKADSGELLELIEYQ